MTPSSLHPALWNACDAALCALAPEGLAPPPKEATRLARELLRSPGEDALLSTLTLGGERALYTLAIDRARSRPPTP